MYTLAKVMSGVTLAQSDTPSRSIAPSRLPDALLAEGRYWATTDELAALLGDPGKNTVRGAISRLVKQGRVFSPARGFYVMIPPEYHSWRSVPPEWFIDPMMALLGRTYYVGLLTAAAMHGAAHQAPQTFQVLTSKSLSDRSVGRAHLRFVTSSRVSDMEVERHVTHTGHFNLASRETTAVDLIWRMRQAGGISNVATIFTELGDLDGDKLARLADLRDRATVRRLGWMLERWGGNTDLHWLEVLARPSEGEPSALSPSSPRKGQVDRRWGVVVNTSVEPDQ